MDKHEENKLVDEAKFSPTEPALPDHLSGRRGAAPPSPSGGPSGKRGAARAALRDSSPGASHDLEAFYRAHGISSEVGEARPYVPWTIDNPEPAYEAWPEDNRKFAERKIATKSDGLIINRYAPEGLNLPHVYAELRPDDDVLIEDHPHWHGDYPPSIEERRRLRRKFIHGKRDHRSGQWVLDKGIRTHIENEHGGKNVNEVHLAESWTHYVFPKGPYAKRIDVNPLAQGSFRDAELVYFCIEGCIKADAILSELLDTRKAPAVFSVPSVTLWPWESDELDETGPELERFARNELLGKPVVIVPDADWIENWMVYRQAMLCRSFLRRCGVEAHVAATDIELYRGHHDLKAIDDARAAHLRGELPLYAEGVLPELIVIDRPVNSASAIVLKYQWGGTRRNDRINNHAAKLLEALAPHAGMVIGSDGKTLNFSNDGTFTESLATIGKIAGLTPRTAQRTIQDLVEKTDAITKVSGSFEIVDRDWHRRGRYFADGALSLEEVKALHPRQDTDELYRPPYEYADTPTFQLHKELRAGTPTYTRLKDMDFTMSVVTRDEKAAERYRLKWWLADNDRLRPLTRAEERNVIRSRTTKDLARAMQRVVKDDLRRWTLRLLLIEELPIAEVAALTNRSEKTVERIYQNEVEAMNAGSCLRRRAWIEGFSSAQRTKSSSRQMWCSLPVASTGVWAQGGG